MFRMNEAASNNRSPEDLEEEEERAAETERKERTNYLGVGIPSPISPPSEIWHSNSHIPNFYST